jgi:hypothetical protein
MFSLLGSGSATGAVVSGRLFSSGGCMRLNRYKVLAVSLVVLGTIATQSCTKSSSGADAPYLGLWVQDEPMLREELAFREFEQEVGVEKANELLTSMPVVGVVLTETEMYLKQGKKDPSKEVEIISSAPNEDGFLVVIKDSNGKRKELAIQVEGEVLKLIEGGKFAQRYRRCDADCLENMNAGMRVLFK